MAEANIYRIQAHAQGLPRYHPNEPCRHGHLSERYTRTGKCVACLDYCSKRWVEQNPEKVKARSARWQKSNPEKCRERARRWRESNPDKAKAATDRYRSTDIEGWRELDRVRSSRRRAQLRGDTGSHTKADLAEILIAQGGRCAYCRVNLKRTKKHVDHIQPLARGGSNGRANLQYLCQTCNVTKSAKDPVDFARSIGLLI